ncbi:MAG TPA: bifunctional phosphoribosyl-AMP cyclohydrolase/phosphoribosyl-ATP diphosphatase [Sutterella sp.]|nr:bifunctional phosphoribosyl-AMP cyclohydrolase/phosphoribosyl-ATP diphosphatase [Sutterella sp.]
MIEVKNADALDFAKSGGLIPAIVQDARTGRVLMLGYMNEEAFQKTCETGLVTFYSRSRQTLWVKGETSGNYLHAVSVTGDCDADTVLVLANPDGPTCHKGTASCFAEATFAGQFLWELEDVIRSRKTADPKTSYTARLFESGTKRIAQKVGEEGVETALAATVHDQDELKNEASDLLFHLLVLLEAEGLSINDVIANLKTRHR